MTGEESGPTIDVYSFACIAYELVAGKPLHEGRTTRGLHQDKLTRPVPPAQRNRPRGVGRAPRAARAGASERARGAPQSLAAISAWSGDPDPAFLRRLFAK